MGNRRGPGPSPASADHASRVAAPCAGRRGLLLTLVGIAVGAAAPAAAQGPSGPTATPPPLYETADPDRRLAIDGAVRVLSAYVSRGFVEEDDGVAIQPELQATYTFVDRGSWSLGALAGAFASFHSEATGVNDPTRAVDRWFEVAGWLGLSLDVGALSIRPYYEVTQSPSGAGQRAQEFAVLVAWDDAGWHERVSLQPRLLLVRETEDAADGGETGTYLGLGLEPVVTFPVPRLGDVRVWMPLELGLSLSDFYEDEDGRDDALGYGSVGAFAALPLPFLRRRAGAGAGSPPDLVRRPLPRRQRGPWRVDRLARRRRRVPTARRAVASQRRFHRRMA